MEENNQKSLLEKGIEKGKEYAKNKAKKKVGNWFVKVVLPRILPYIGGFFLILLAMGVILAVQFAVQDLIDSILGIFDPSAENVSTGTYSSDILEAAQQVSEEEMDWIYHTNHEKGEASLISPVEAQIRNPNKTTCCASYVACVLYASGYMSSEELGSDFHSPSGLEKQLKKHWGEDTITNRAELKPGDIVIFDKGDSPDWPDHVQIYAGGDKWYNGGSGGVGQPMPQYQASTETLFAGWKMWWAYRLPEDGPKHSPAPRANTDYNGQIISIAEDGSYKLNSKDLAEDILEELENKKVNNEVIGFNIDDLVNMIDKYIEAEVKTSFPETKHPNNEIDGMIKIKRALATGGESELIDLEYMNYEDFCKKAYSQDTSALRLFSINPKTLQLCIAVKGNVTVKTNFDGSQITEGDGMRISEIDYQKYVQNNITPLNFFVSLHLISQDLGFMTELLEAATNEGGLEITYVDTSIIATTEYDYSGRIYYTYEEDLTEEEKELIKNQGYEKFDIIDYNEIKEHYEDTSEFKKVEEYRYRGKLYVTNADTYLSSASKSVNKSPNIIAGGTGKSTNEVVNKYLSDEGIEVINTETEPIQSLKTERKRNLVINEITNVETTSTAYRVNTKEKQINVEKFIELIKKYPNVEENFVTAPSTIFYFLGQTEKTQRQEMVMKYVLYQLTDLYHGIDSEDLEFLSDNFFSVSDGYRETLETKIWYSLLEKGYSEYAVAGIMGNLYEISKFKSNELENEYEYLIGFTDETYTEAINAILKPRKESEEGNEEENSEEEQLIETETYTREQFIFDQAGYGIALWNTEARKEALYDFAKEKGVGIDNEDMQIQYLLIDLKNYQDDSWINAESVEEATKAFYITFIDPNEIDTTHIEEKAKEFYEQYHGKSRNSFAGFSKGTKLIFNGKYFFPEYQQFSNKYSSVPYGGPRAYRR